ncbi:MAG: hypothetical protein PHT79_06395 [Syntrophomonadaceae bacterium]|nr:hypothetical protein [Syntrophomonadaceae bacterium]MDD3889101.1 hypothetical protein [Syntrophomonadaceae bacterium]MDD4549374.1 hypothetical protein [Syntrophomonadaceae bacterium]
MQRRYLINSVGDTIIGLLIICTTGLICPILIEIITGSNLEPFAMLAGESIPYTLILHTALRFSFKKLLEYNQDISPADSIFGGIARRWHSNYLLSNVEWSRPIKGRFLE